MLYDRIRVRLTNQRRCGSSRTIWAYHVSLKYLSPPNRRQPSRRRLMIRRSATPPCSSPFTDKQAAFPPSCHLMRLWLNHGDFTSTPKFFKKFTPFLLFSPYSKSTNQISNLRQPKPQSPNSARSPTSHSSVAVIPSPDVTTICSLLSHQDASALDFDSLLSDYKGRLSSNLVLDILRNYRHLGRVKTLEFFSWAGSQLKFQFDDSVIEYAVDFLGRRKLFDDMKCLLVTVSSYKGQISCRAFAICIRFLGRDGRVKEALSLFEEMEDRFMCKPDNFLYNNMLYVLCKKDSTGELMDVAISVFRRIECPDTYSYSNILVGLCKFGRFEVALDVFQDMGKVGLVPTRSAVNILIGDLCVMSAKEESVHKVKVHHKYRPFTILVPNIVGKTGALRPAVGIFWAAYDMGVLPSAFVISRLVSDLCRLGKIEKAVEILTALGNRKISCLEECYSNVMKSLCESCLVEESTKLFENMLSFGIEPKLLVYNYIICMFCKMEKLDAAESAFQVMRKKLCIPDNTTFTAMIHAYGRADKWESAYGLSMEMLSLGICPHFNTYSVVDRLLKDHGMIDLCGKLEEKFDAQMLLKHCKVGDFESAYDKLQSMLQKGVLPPVYIRDAFESKFRKHGKARELDEVLNRAAS